LVLLKERDETRISGRRCLRMEQFHEAEVRTAAALGDPAAAVRPARLPQLPTRRRAVDLPHAAPTDILMYGLDPECRLRVEEALLRGRALGPGRWAAMQVPDEEALVRAAIHSAPVLVLVAWNGRVDRSRDPEEAGPVERPIERLVGRLPSTPIVVYAAEEELDLHAAHHLGRIGVPKVIRKGVDDDPERLADTLVQVAAFGSGMRALEEVSRGLPDPFVRLLRKGYRAARMPENPRTGRLTAATLCGLWMAGAHRSTAAAALRQAGLPPPGWLARWLVGLRAVAQLGNPGARPEGVARALGLPSAAALRELLRRLTGRPTRGVRTEDLVRAFRDRCRQVREKTERRRRRDP